MNAFLDAALACADRLDWRMGPVEPQGKRPLTRHGVKDFTTDLDTIRSWWRKWPTANVGAACGKPHGPTVVDADDLQVAGEVLTKLRRLDPPISATARGQQLFFEGIDRGTIALGYGELRGVGSYVVVPPSIHPTGKQYTWLAEPWRRKLPPLPAGLARKGTTAGAGVMSLVEQVPPGQMYGHLLDLATRLAQARILSADVLERMLVVQFEAVRMRDADYGDPRSGRRDTRRLAEFAVTSEIAERERRQARKGTSWRT